MLASVKQPTRRRKQAVSYRPWLLGATRRHSAVLAMLGAFFFALSMLSMTRVLSIRRQLGDANYQSRTTIMFPLLQNEREFHKPTSVIDAHRSPNFGDVNVNLFTNDGMEKIRRIYRDIRAERGESVDSKHPESERDFFDYIYNFDDDYLRNPLWTWEDDKIQDEKTCRRNAWHRKSPMDCNSMHELDLQGLLTEEKMKALG